MTTAPQPLGRLSAIAERVVCGLSWTMQVSAAAAYLAVAAQPAAWHNAYATDAFGAVCFWLIGLSMVLIWALSLWEETRSFYDRRQQRLHRRLGLFGHLTALLIAGLTAVQLPDRAGWLAFLGTMSFSAVTTWAVWMHSRFLPDEDQAVVDTILNREATERAAAFDASERERRRERLSEIVAALGYELVDTPPKASKQAEAPPVKWPIPTGKHKPLVYFMRNGNRMKIGTTVELKRRIRTLALRAENVALLVEGGEQRERQFHKQFAEHRIGNTEWFAYEGSLVDYVNDQISSASPKGKGQ